MGNSGPFILRCPESVSAKLAGEHLSVWQVGLGRFGFGLLIVPFIVKALGLSLLPSKSTTD